MDIVITYVNGLDTEWQKNYEKYTYTPIIEKRFREYNDKTIHVANHYKQKGIYIDIEGNCSVDEVFDFISQAIDQMN